MTRPRPIGSLVAAMLLGGCADTPREVELPIVWRAMGEVSLDQAGRSSLVTIDVPGDVRYLSLRAVPLDADDELADTLCYRFGPVTELVSGAELVAPAEDQDPASRACSSCVERVYAGPDRAFAVWPSGAEPLPPGSRLALGVELRDCATGLRASRTRIPGAPTRLRIELASEAATATRGPLRLRVRVAVFADAGIDPGDAAFDVLWSVAAERFARAGVTLERERTLRLPSASLGVVFGPSDTSALDDIATAIRQAWDDDDDTRYVPLAVVSCLRHEDPIAGSTALPLGVTTRIPDSLALGARASLVMLAVASCSTTAPPEPSSTARAERLGLVLAHELGHYLGIHHADSAAGLAPRGADERLMERHVWELPIDRAWFSELEALVLRRHPDLSLP